MPFIELTTLSSLMHAFLTTRQAWQLLFTHCERLVKRISSTVHLVTGTASVKMLTVNTTMTPSCATTNNEILSTNLFTTCYEHTWLLAITWSSHKTYTTTGLWSVTPNPKSRFSNHWWHNQQSLQITVMLWCCTHSLTLSYWTNGIVTHHWMMLYDAIWCNAQSYTALCYESLKIVKVINLS
jgi:hypothetical protein